MPAINVQKANEPVTPKQPAGNEGPETDANEPYLGNWKSKEAAEEGLANLQGKLDSQGNELGLLRKQVDFFMQGQNQPQPKAEPKQPEEPTGPDYAKEMKAIQDKKASLDPDEPGYQKEIAKLDAQAYGLVREQTAQEVLTMSQAEFKKVLDERDTQTMHNKFYEENPEFDTPEMQMRIQEYLANDKTGMSDPMVAFREIQRDDAAEAARLAQEENEELKRLLDLKKGEEETGKVVTKAQSPSQQKTKQPKATGAELNRGMMEALQKAKAA